MSIDPQKIKELKSFIQVVEQAPELLNKPELAFFRDYLTKMGCTKLPTATSAGGCGSATDKGGCCPGSSSPKSKPAKTKVEEVVESEEEESEEDPEIPDYVSDGEDVEGKEYRLKEETDELPKQPAAGTEEKELTEEEQDKQNALKGAAQEAIEDGDNKKAVEKLGEAFEIGAVSAMMFSKRADLLLKSKRPKAAIVDAEAALKLNPDSAKAYRVRGMSHRRMGKWAEAQADLGQAQKLDFDDSVEDHLKFVLTKCKLIEKIKVAQRSQKEERAEKDRAKRIKRAQKERKKAAEEQRKRDEREAKMGGGMGGMGGMPGGMPGGMGGMPGMPGMGGKGAGKGGLPPGMGDLFSDPELMAAMGNPKVMQAFQEIMQNPAAFAKYQNDPEVMGVMEKMMGKMGGMGGMPGGMGGMGGMPGGMGGMPGGMGGMGGMPGMGGMGGMPGAGASNFADVEECD